MWRFREALSLGQRQPFRGYAEPVFMKPTPSCSENEVSLSRPKGGRERADRTTTMEDGNRHVLSRAFAFLFMGGALTAVAAALAAGSGALFS